MRILEFGNRTYSVIRERPYARAAIVIGIGSILLLVMLTPLVTPVTARENNSSIHITGTFVSFGATSVVASYTITHGSTTTTVTDLNIVADFTETGTNGHGEEVAYQTCARDMGSNIGVCSATVTYNGTVGNSRPGLYSLIRTYTIDYTDPSHITFGGPMTVIQGSGQGGLAGICGQGTFQGVVGTPGAGTFEDTFHFGASCAPNSPRD